MIYKNQNIYGYSVGILVIEGYFPRLPGAIGNATTFDFPVYCRVVKGGTGSKVVRDTGQDVLDMFIKECKWLEEFGVRSITTSCGFTAKYQKELADSVNIPVFASSLLLAPLLYSFLKQNEKVGIITADFHYITDDHYKGVGIDKSRVVTVGLEDYTEFTDVVFNDRKGMDVNKIEDEVVDAALMLVKNNPDVKTILLECSLLPPFARAVQEAVQLPVYDFTSLINFAHSGFIRKDFVGYF